MKRGLYLILIYILIFRANQKNKAFFETDRPVPAKSIVPAQVSFAGEKWTVTNQRDSLPAGLPSILLPVRNAHYRSGAPVKDNIFLRKSYLAVQ